MPQVPLVDPPIAGPSAAPVRANPGMFDAVGEAGARVGQAIEQVGDLAYRIKSATDTAYVTKAQMTIEAAPAEFSTWAKNHPDTSTWQAEWDARMTGAKDDALSGAGNLSWAAKLHLNTAIANWEKRGKVTFGGLVVDQDITNAKGIATDGVNQAIASNDAASAHAIIDTAVKQGVFSPTAGAVKTKSITVGIATNLANADVETDPFTAVNKLNAKDAAGEYVNYQGLPQAARVNMLFRATRDANNTRTQSMREWGEMIAKAQAGNGIMPDEEGVRAEAERQGIPKKQIDKLFIPPKPFDPHEYATAYNSISAYDADKDPTHEQIAGLVGQIEGFKGDAKVRLNALLTSRSDPKSELNNPVAKGVLDQMKMDREQSGTFIPEAIATTPGETHWFKANEPDTRKAVLYHGGLNDLRNEIDGTAIRKAMTPAEIEARWGKGATRENILGAEAMNYAQQVQKMTAWLDDHPKATATEAEEYRQSLAAPYVMESVKSALGVPQTAPAKASAAAPAQITTEAEFNALPSGASFVWNGRQGRKK